MLLISDGMAYTSEQQFAPLVRHAGELGNKYGLVVELLGVDAGLKLAPAELNRFDIVGFKLSFRMPAAEAGRIATHLHDALAGSTSRLVYFDGDDDVCIQWPDVLAKVDCYVKKHVFANDLDYTLRYVGKSNLTDFVARQSGWSFEDDAVAAATGPVPAELIPRIHLGWNIGLDDKIAALAHNLQPTPPDAKDIDVGSRAFVKPDVWIHPLRAGLVDRIAAMGDRYRVSVPDERVSQDQYYEEMKRARICVSPFGYGELCWRDFEAVLCGCLVVKPDMGHLRTWPDIFVVDETYAPVAWDYSNLEVVCARYLDDEPARLRIAQRARQVLIDALDGEHFATVFGLLLQKLSLLPADR